MKPIDYSDATENLPWAWHISKDLIGIAVAI